MSVATLTSIADFETSAQEKLLDYVWLYYSRTAGTGQTYQDNLEAFRRYRLIPRNLRDVSIRDTSITVLGSKLDIPVAIAPTGFHRFAHPDAELATAKGATAMNAGMVLGSWSIHSLEEVAAATPGGIHWFYMLFYNDRGHMKRQLDRAERAGYYWGPSVAKLNVYIERIFSHTEGLKKFSHTDRFFSLTQQWKKVAHIDRFFSLTQPLEKVAHIDRFFSPTPKLKNFAHSHRFSKGDFFTMCFPISFFINVINASIYRWFLGSTCTLFFNIEAIIFFK
ncbi:2-Hydroxyacid oxidase 2-like [Branchiostoma floridae x Branchiostoma japonicum]